jgi:hypothetical protein
MVLSPLPHNFFRNCVALFIVDSFPAVLLSVVDVLLAVPQRRSCVVQEFRQ